MTINSIYVWCFYWFCYYNIIIISDPVTTFFNRQLLIQKNPPGGDCTKIATMSHFSIWPDWTNLPFVCLWGTSSTQSIFSTSPPSSWAALFESWTSSVLFVQHKIYKHLCIIFGTTPSMCSRTVNWMLRNRMLPYKNVLTRDSLRVGMHMGRLLAQSQKGWRGVFPMTCTIISSSFQTFTHCWGKQVSGGCMDCEVHSLVARSTCPVTPPCA